MGPSFEFLTAQNNFPSNACTEGHEEKGREKSTATKGEVSVGDGFGVARSPVARLCNFNASQFELTWESGY